MVEDKIKEIRSRLRLVMNGVTSSSMRERGIVYKLNFGVPYPEIKQIAASFEPEAELAAALWKEDIREFKILATLLFPADAFSNEMAKQWIKEIPYLEIAESCSKNLFCKLPDVETLTLGLIYNVEDEYARTVAYLIWCELFREGKELIPPIRAAFLVESMRTTLWTPFNASLKEKQAAITAMKFYGRQSNQKAAQIMNMFDEMPEYKEKPEQVEIYNDLKFEFEYYG
jgi:DNA alkylation repair enzyme